MARGFGAEPVPFFNGQLCGAALGVMLLIAYNIGHCGLALIAGTSLGLVQQLADSKGGTRGTDALRRSAGVLTVAVGARALLFA